jgi:hypothetical protein
MSYCGENSAVKDASGVRTAVSLRCRSWNCPDCRDRRKAQLTAEAIGGRPNTFLTLTMRRTLDFAPSEAAPMLTNAWRILRKRALREAARDRVKNPVPFGAAPPGGWKLAPGVSMPRQVSLFQSRLPFLAVIEKHKSGWPHLHILLRSRWIEHAWLSAQMLDLLASPVVSIERLKSVRKSAVYCSKYCSKAAAKFTTTKRYWKSQDYDERPKWKSQQQQEGASPYEMRHARLDSLAWHWANNGYAIEYQSQHKFLAYPPGSEPERQGRGPPFLPSAARTTVAPAAQ